MFEPAICDVKVVEPISSCLKTPYSECGCVDVDSVWQPPSELHTEVGQPKQTHPPKQGHSGFKQDQPRGNKQPPPPTATISHTTGGSMQQPSANKGQAPQTLMEKSQRANWPAEHAQPTMHSEHNRILPVNNPPKARRRDVSTGLPRNVHIPAKHIPVKAHQDGGRQVQQARSN